LAVRRLVISLSVILTCFIAGASRTSADSLPPYAHCLHQAGSGGDVVLEACDPYQLAYAFKHHLLSHPGLFHVRIRGYRSGETYGMVQVIGNPPLTPNSKIVMYGRPGRHTDVNLSVRRLDTHTRTGAQAVLLVSAKAFHMDAQRMTWTIFWPKGRIRPQVLELSPHRRIVPSSILRIQTIKLP
jgi:hypothetical protein